MRKFLSVISLLALFVTIGFATKVVAKTKEDYLERGNSYYRSGKYQQAIKEYNQAIHLDPKFARAYYNRGLAYDDKGQHDKAIIDYTKAIEINPKDAEAYINRGNAYGDLRKYQFAIKDYNEAIRIDPENQIVQEKRYFARSILERQAWYREEQAFLWLWQVCFGIAFFSGLLKGRKVFGFLLGITGPLGAIVVLCTPSTIKRCVACKNNIPKKAIKCPQCQTDQPEKLILEKELPVKRSVIKWIFLLVPILLWLSSIGSCIYKHYRTDQFMKEADGLIWGDNSTRLIVRVQDKLIGEKNHYRILVVKPDGKIAHESEMIIDNDMWGGGFVKAVNADDDAELEVVAWGAHEARESFYLDYLEGIVQQKSFSHATTETKDLAREWHNDQDADLVPFFLFFPLIVYYILFGIVSLVVRLWRRRRSKTLKYKKQLA
ncbi:MAG: tetratricopeptide repeat protein [Deltaproteobacteria bacterium]|nr:tetratricopeptide repeat protein [Deltaproteobacteria bacterium]RLC28909.1 MAG: hypothetical protein DRH13_06460 [Candidatus Woesebacteria bacterium]